MVLLAMARDRLRGVPNYSPKAYRVRVEVFLILIVFLIELVLTRKIDVVSGTSNSSRDDSCANMVVRCESSAVSADTISPQVCGSGCCTKEMEKILQMRSHQDFTWMLTNLTDSPVDIFNSSRLKFDDFFTRMLDQSSVDLHDMFVKTYGLLYQQNSDIFVDLFRNLHRYFKGLGAVDVSVALEEFFSRLMQRIFILLNAQHDFDENYLNCISDNVDKIKPFGDVPASLIRQIKRSFIAAKTFVHGLAVGCNAIDAISKVRMTDRCIREVTQMLHCSQCSGFPCARPCQAFCQGVTSKCLQLLYTDLSENWIIFIDELVKVAERLEGPFNIENVVDPIEVKISEAIMNFQSNFDTLSKQIFTECGEPEQREDQRRRRSLNATETTTKDKKSRKKVKEKSAEDLGRLDHLVRDIRSVVQKTKFFWKSLVNITCDSLMATNESLTTTCWNGSHLVSTETVTSSSSVGLPLPDVDFLSSTVIEQQIAQLRAISVKLKMAVSGMDANWIDSGSVGSEDGSGSGSGDSEDDEKDDGDTEEEEEEEEDGSRSLLTFDEESHDHSYKSQTKTVMLTTSSSKRNHRCVRFVDCPLVTHSAIALLFILLSPNWLN